MSQYLSQNRIEEPIWLEPTELAFLREQAESLEAQISELTRQTDAKLAELATFRNILSPVRRIPVEILSKIFQLACHPKRWYFQFQACRCLIHAQPYQCVHGLEKSRSCDSPTLV
ncbi:hypothetical protein BT96DRAFT_150561 [Gymnopus androsaceus JB14]|uniref:Uncharacterized protein n=1 Tax=Gymnopus androsaceus JB14 TaxID=1447944 RepID=A0A6A4IBR0_9AGAR|nr:hypothetical protein BT96DRAFT_150561 [Gymnopus androsaceus JB14]